MEAFLAGYLSVLLSEALTIGCSPTRKRGATSMFVFALDAPLLRGG